MRRIVEDSFARLFPSRLQPVELGRKLERAMDDNIQIQNEGRRLAPNVYDISLSIEDHQQLSPNQALIRDWQNQLVEFARRRNYILGRIPVIRLHPDNTLHTGIPRIEAKLVDQHVSGGADASASGIMPTQELSREDLERLRIQLPPVQQIPDNPIIGSTPTQYPAPPTGGPATHPPMPKAKLTYRSPKGGQQVYPIEKPVVSLGRDLSNDILIEDKGASRFHAQIKYQSDGQFTIFDLGSTNGITVNNTPHTRQHTLRNGDHFSIRSYDFHFEVRRR